MEDKRFTSLILYCYWRSTCSWRVRIALNMKNIDYEIKPIHLVKGDQKSEEFTKLNPIQRVPVLSFRDTQSNKIINLAESTAICEFLEEAFPENKLLPSDTIAKAQVRSLCSEIASNVQPVQNLSVIKRIAEIGGNKAEWAKEWITVGLKAFEKMISATQAKYCFGDEVTMADAFLIPQLYNARRFEVDMSQFPNIQTIEKNLEELEAFKKAHPSNQPDAQ